MPQPGPAEDSVRALFDALKGGRRVCTQGLGGAGRGYVLARVQRQLEAPLICVTADEESADLLASDLAFFLGGRGSLDAPKVLRLPADEILPYDELSPDSAVVGERLGALFHLQQGTAFSALVLSLRALSRKVLPPAWMNDLSEWVSAGQTYDRDALARRLVAMGYQSAPLVEEVGTFAVRGGIVDVFSPLYARPLRLELFGDTVESVKSFDPESQRTQEALEAAYLCPARELLLTDQTQAALEGAIRRAAERVNVPSAKVRERIDQVKEGLHTLGLEPLFPGFFEGGARPLFDYFAALKAAPVFYLDDPVGLERAQTDLWREVQASFEASEKREELSLVPEEHFLTPDQVAQGLASYRRVEGGGLAIAGASLAEVRFTFTPTRELREALLSHHGEEGALTPLVDRLSELRDLGVTVAMAMGSLGQADRLKRLLFERNVMVRLHPEPMDEPAKLRDPSVWAHLFTGEVSSGFIDRGGGFAVIPDEDVFGPRSRRKAPRRRLDTFLAAEFRELKEGDLVVHTDFGIARYQGLKKMDVRGVQGDFLMLEYAGRDKVYLPVSRMRVIQKFTGGDPEKVQLDRLGTQTWEKTKKRVKENLLKMAAELLKLYAARKAHQGYAFAEPDRYFRQFESDFEFEETPDQEKAIADVLADMEKPEPMDRLVCGDVGYGKTEVAMRAAFLTVLNKKQVAVLVPTTVLAQQHYQTFTRRFAGYPVSVEVLSRMRSDAESRDALQRVREGKVDVLIGTHKLLGSGVAFRDLGLLVVDEEHRFGVKQKERIKQLKTQVDVLTLTATPIPRTLHMSMSGVRDMTIIATPPQDRRAIRTFVMKFSEEQIREAVLREVKRGGQVFFVHNRVESIHSMEDRLRELLPGVTLAVAHGQMAEGRLEQVMTEFVEKKHQVLLCTSIIESGIDIPSANTLIVNRADAFGLAQLYQLRGRVGRSKERAYAYLLVPAGRTITRDAQRRLEVLQAFTELGAGFSIASHDLEIRGAGNLLGPEQSGSIAAIGFDLYAQLLDEAVSELKGEPPKEEIEPELNLPLPALIPDHFIPDVHQRLVFYKRFAMAESADELSDLRAELVDRFGEAPDEVDHLHELTLLKLGLRELRVRSLEGGPSRLVCTLGHAPALDPEKLAGLVARSKGALRLTPDMKLVAKLASEPKGAGWLVESKKLVDNLHACRAAG